MPFVLTPARAARLRAATRYCGVAVLALATTIYSSPALADPAPNSAAPNFSQTTAGAFSTTVPDGICSVITSTRGGSGASSGITVTNSGLGGGGAVINARFNVLPGQAIGGAVGSGGVYSTSLTAPNGGIGTANGGSSGNSSTGFLTHRGGGGGGSSSISVAGIKVVEAGGGGGGGASHSTSSTTANGGGGGFSLSAPGVAPGLNGLNGVDGTTTVNGGRGGGAAAGGAGGTGAGSLSGLAGSGIGTGTGGNGGPNDRNTDTGGGGGGGYTGGGGGASTTNSTRTAGGGGGGSSFVRATSPTLAAPAPTAISGSAGPVPASGSVNGDAGFVYIDFVPCVYALSVTKSASAVSVNAGQAVRWTITVRNTGTDPMTKGDTVTLADTLPTGGGSTFRVVSVSTTPGSTDPNMASGAITCTGVTVGGTMPASTDCSRPYSAPSAPGAPSGGVRGLNAGETLTIVYDQIFNNAIPAATVSNTASTVDRSGTTVTGTAPNTDTQGTNGNRNSTAAVSVLPYDLRVRKSASSATVTAGSEMTWTVEVTNLGPGDMFGPDATAANPLIVTDAAPTTNVSAPVSFTSSGPAGTCTYASGTITCSGGLAFNQTQTFTFKQTVNAAAPAGATVSNTASVTDYFTGDSNDSAVGQFTIAASSDLATTKTRLGGSATPAVGDTVTYQVTVTNNGPSAATNVSLTDTLPAGLTATAGNGTVSQGSYSAGTGLWTVGSLASGATATLTLVGTVNAGQGGLAITNTTTAATTPDQPDPTATGDDLTETVNVFLPAIVAVTDSASGINGNTGQSNIYNVLTNDTLNAITATTGTVTTTVTAPASNPGVTLNPATGNVSVAAGTPAGNYTIGYRICEIANPTNCANSTATVTVAPSADLQIVKSNGVSTVTSGSTVTYTVTVTNLGTDTITGAVVTDVVGAGLTCPAGNAVTIAGSGIPAGSFTIANLTGSGIVLGTLSSGQSAVLSYSCQVN